MRERSIVRGPTHAELRSYVVFNQKGVVSVRRSLPSLRNGQWAVRLVLKVPLSIFEADVATLTAEVPPRKVIRPIGAAVE